MYLGIFAGIPVFLNVLLMLGAMYLLVYMLSADTTFSVSETVLTRSISKSAFLFRNSADKQFGWSDVKAYKNGTDRGAYRGEFQFLEIRFRNGSEWKITDMYGERKAGFITFLHSFLANVERYNLTQRRTEPLVAVSAPGPTFLSDEGLFIERKKTFYETIWGKSFTILLGAFIVMLLLFAGPYMGATSLFKLNFVLIPGFAYMFYRTFIKKYR